MKPYFCIALLGLFSCKGSVGIEDGTGSFDGTDDWWNVGSGSTDGDGGPGDDDDDDFTEDDAVREVWGDLELPGGNLGEGWWGVFEFDPDNGGILCEMEGEVISAVASNDCPSCDFAWELRLGQPEVYEEVNGACASAPEMAWAGATIKVGHASPETLYADVSNGWEIAGFSEMEGDSWFFEIEDEYGE